MEKINSPGTPKISCTYRIDLHTEKHFQCPAIQKCCGSACCDDELLDTNIIWGSIALLALVLVISGICWYIRGRKRSRDIVGKQQQLVSNMIAANQGPGECVVSLQEDDVGKSRSQSAKVAVLPRNFSFTQALFPPPNSKIEKCFPGSNDQQPLLDDSHWDGKPTSVISESQMKI